VRAGEIRRAVDGRMGGELDRSPYAARLLAHVVRVTGVAATLPGQS
jgi:hypothetical protein